MTLETKDLISREVDTTNMRVGVNTYFLLRMIIQKQPYQAVCEIRQRDDESPAAFEKRILRVMEVLQKGVDVLRAEMQQKKLDAILMSGISETD